MSQAPKSLMDLYWILNNTPAIDTDFGLYIRKKRQQIKKYEKKENEKKRAINKKEKSNNTPIISVTH